MMATMPRQADLDVNKQFPSEGGRLTVRFSYYDCSVCHNLPPAPLDMTKSNAIPCPHEKPWSIDIIAATQTGHAHAHTPPPPDWTVLRRTSAGSHAFDACLQTGAEREGAQCHFRVQLDATVDLARRIP